MKLTDKSCIIMDEVDGMSAGDRGGVGALNALIKKTKVSEARGSGHDNFTDARVDPDYMHRERQERAEVEAVIAYDV